MTCTHRFKKICPCPKDVPTTDEVSQTRQKAEEINERFARDRVDTADVVAEPPPKKNKGGQPMAPWKVRALNTPPVEDQILAALEDPELRVELLKILNASCALDNFAMFCQLAWHVVEPATELQWNWHHTLLANTLQALFESWLRAGEVEDYVPPILNTAISICPGALKSKITSVFFPVWCWLRAPGMKFVCLSVNEEVALRDARASRDLIKSDWFQTTFQPEWKLKADQDAISNYGNTAGGERLSKPSGSAIVGLRGDVLLYDDPNSADENQSERSLINEIWDASIYSRVNSGTRSLRIGIQQRVGAGDWTDHVIKKQGHWSPENPGGWLNVVLPAEYEAERKYVMPECLAELLRTKLGRDVLVADPRENEGDSIHPARFSKEYLEAERKRWEGTANYACTPAETPILMGDWTEKPIAEVCAGDQVVGFEVARNRHNKARLVEATVLRTFRYDAEVFELEMESGRTVRCTADHQWYTRRRPTGAEPNRRSYVAVTPGKTRLCLVAEPLRESTAQNLAAWNYLAGIVDGEGTMPANALMISQSPAANPETFARIREVLDVLGISHRVWRGDPGRENWSERGQYTVHDAPYVLRALMQWTHFAKRAQAKELLYRRGKDFVKERDRVLGMRSLGVQPVFALETTTGNYVAWGYASSNSQYQQRPALAAGNLIKRRYWNFFRLDGGVRPEFDEAPKGRPRPAECHDGPSQLIKAKHHSPGNWDFDWVCISIDCAAKKTDKGSNWGLVAIAGKEARRYVLDDRTRRGDILEVVEVLRAMIKMWKPDKILIESKAAGPDLQLRLKGEMEKGAMTPIMLEEVKAVVGKEERLMSCLPTIANGMVYLLDGAAWLDEFVEEMSLFPNGVRDDRVDALSQCLNHYYVPLEEDSGAELPDW